MKKIGMILLSLMMSSAFAQSQEIDGEQYFIKICSGCHGVSGERTPPTPEPINTMSLERIEARINRAMEPDTRGRMDRAIKAQELTLEQAKVIAEYIVKNLKPEQ